MSDVPAPRGLNEMPSVSWFEFVLNDKLLGEHLSKENPEPSAVQLLVQFMQQAETEMNLSMQNRREQAAAAANVSPGPDGRGENSIANGATLFGGDNRSSFHREIRNRSPSPSRRKEQHEFFPIGNRAKQEFGPPGNRARQEFIPPGNKRNQESIPLGNRAGHEFVPLGNKTKQEFTPPRNQSNQKFTLPRNQAKQEFIPPQNRSNQKFTPPWNQAKQEFIPPRNLTKQEFTPPRNQAKQDFSPSRNPTKQEFTPPQNQTKQKFTPPRNQTKQEFIPPRNQAMQESFPPRNRENWEFMLPESEAKQEFNPHEVMKGSGPSPQKVMEKRMRNKRGEKDWAKEENRKVKALKVLALKLAAHLHWDIAVLEQGVPTPIVQSLLITLLKIAAPELIDCIHSPDLEDKSMSDQSLFAALLFHRWCVRSVVRGSFPTRPLKQSFVSAPGQVDMNAMIAAVTENIIRKFREQLPQSISFLEKCCQDQVSLHMPMPDCFGMPKANADSSVDWEQTVLIPSEKVICQVSFDLGSLYFFDKEYRKAFEKFRTCRQILNQLSDQLYCNINMDRLRGYLTSCSSLLGVTMENPTPSVFDRAEASRKRDYQGIVVILQEDNLKQELTMAHRTSIQDELSKSGQYQLHIQVTLCNVVRMVLEGQAVVNPILNALSNADEEIHIFLINLLSELMKGCSQAQRSNLKCFVWHLIQMLPPESAFSRLVVDSDLAVYFNEAEVAEMAVEDIDSDHLYLQDLGMDVATAPTSYPSTRESSYNVSDVEGQLLAVYEPVVIRDLLTDLYENRGLHPSQIIALNDRWKVPKEIRQALEFLPDAEFKQAYVFVLIAKARHCMDLRIFERARQLLTEADAVVADLSYVLSKHVRWQILLADLMQYFISETVSEASTIQELVKKTKTCLTSIRLAQDIQPSSEVLEQCTAFLLNSRDWEYLSNLENTANGYIEMSRLLSCVCKELPQAKNIRKPARELWENICNIFMTNAQPKRSAMNRDSAMMRELPLALLSMDSFFAYVQKMKEPLILTLLISAFAKLFAIVKAEITSEIATEYSGLWPSAVSSSNFNTDAVEDMLKTVMEHALKVNPTQPSWLRTQADIYYAEQQHSTAMKFYLEAGVVATHFFSIPVPSSLYDDKAYRRMITCCTHLKCHTQVAVLCQFLNEVDYRTAFTALKERNVYDAMDAYYCCIWDITILEFLVHLHGKNGEMDKRQCATRALSQMDLNSNNPEEIKRRAIHVRKTKFLRALAKQYVG